MIVPTIAGTDAPCSALSVIYTDEGVFEEYLWLPAKDVYKRQGVGRAVGCDEQLCAAEIRRVHRYQLDLAWPLAEPGRLAPRRGGRVVGGGVPREFPNALTGASGVRRRAALGFRGQHGLLLSLIHI